MNHIESATLSGIIHHGHDALIDVSDLISANSFTEQKNQILYKVLAEILNAGQNIDLPTIITYSKSLGFDNFVEKNNKYLNELINSSTKLENVRQHARSLMKTELIRKAKQKHKLAYELLNKMSGTETVEQILSTSENPIFELLNETFESAQPEQIASKWNDYMKNKKENKGGLGLPTPFPIFNSITGGGLRKGGVTLIGSRAGVGKSTIGKECAIFLAKQGIPVLFIDTEMLKDEQLDRILSSETEIPISEIENGDFLSNAVSSNKIKKAHDTISSLPLYHKEVYGKTFPEILSIIRRWIFKDVGFDNEGRIKPCLVVYDYFKLMSSDDLQDMKEFEALGYQISELTDFCKEYSFPCLSFVQLNRDGITKETSDIIAQSDRLLWLCLTVAVFKEKSREEIAETGHFGNMKLIPLKTRFGPGLLPGNYINLKFNRQINKINEGITMFEASQRKHEISFE